MDKPFPGIAASLLLVVIVATGQLGVGFLFKDFMTEHLLLGVAAVNVLVLGTLCAVGYTLSREGPALGRGRTPRSLLPAALAVTALGGAVALGFVADWLSRVFPLPAQFSRMLADMLEGPPAEAVLALVVVAPLTEELLFRGLVLRGLERRHGAVPALLLSSALFALSHFNLVQAVPAFAAGLYLGWLYRATGTLWWPIAAHAFFNGLSLVVAFLFPEAGSAADAGPMLWPWAAAGAAVLAAGIWLTRKSVPLSPSGVSDKVAP